MTGLPDFKELVASDLERRKAVQAQNIKIRDEIVAALLKARDERTPWKAYTPEGEAADNVTKRINISCEDDFRLHLIIANGGRVTFPKPDVGETMTVEGSGDALVEIAHRYAIHRFPDEAVVLRRTISAR